MFDFVLTAVPSICATYSLDSVGDVPGEIPPPFQPGWSPPPPPPPPPVTVVSAEVNVADSGPLILTLSGPVTGSDPFVQAHPWTIDANGTPGNPTVFFYGSGSDVWLWAYSGPYDAPLTLTVPADSELDVVAGTFPISTS